MLESSPDMVCEWALRMGTVEPWESGKPGVGFPLSHGPPRLWECGNRAAISKDGGKSGKPASGFPGFPRAVISIAFGLRLVESQ